MTTAPGRGPTALGRLLAIAAALALGIACSRFGTGYFLHNSRDEIGLLVGFGLLAATWTVSPYAGLAVHDWLLRRAGAVLPPVGDPRGARAALAWAAGVSAGAMPATLLFLVDTGIRDLHSLNPEPRLVADAWKAACLAAPTIGLLVTRALRRRWGTPTVALQPTPPVLPAPA